MVHNHDGTVGESNAAHPRYRNPLDQKWNFDANVVQLNAEQKESWPSVAKCTADLRGEHTSMDEDPCDHDNRMVHNHDGTLGESNAAHPRYRNPTDQAWNFDANVVQLDA